MHEYEVTLRNGKAFVYADTYLDLGGVVQFYRGDEVVQEYDRRQVVGVVEVW